MAAKKNRHESVTDLVQVFGKIPEIMGLELVLNKGTWMGRYYITGERHSWRKDKLKVRIWNNSRGNDIWVFEEGGQCMSLATWLVNFGGAADYKTAYRIIEGNESVVSGFAQRYISENGSSCVVGEKYVDKDEYNIYKQYSLWDCALFRWMCGLFGKQAVEEVWNLYGATTDERGLAVWWYIDTEGRICYDKRMRYLENGHRDKTFGGTRKYRVGDGFTLRPMFGVGNINAKMREKGILSDSNGLYYFGRGIVPPNIKQALRGQKINVVESEKTALLCKLAFGGRWLATGGKGNLREIDDEILLWPDIDAASEWSTRGNTCEWWLDAEELGIKVGENWDIGDFVVHLLQTSKTKID